MEILALSAESREALTESARRLRHEVHEHPNLALWDLCAAINDKPAPEAHRLAVLADSMEQLHERLSGFVSGATPRGLMTGHVSGDRRPRVAFMLTGQGSQYLNMARELYDTLPVFTRALDRCADLLRSSLAEPLLSVLYADADRPTPLHETAYTQPALFALEYALAQVWRSWGIEPDVLIGHSVGEYTAACLADVFTLDEGLRLIALRGRLMQALPADGGMAVVFADEARVSAAIEPYRDTVSIAALNGPGNTVISGLSATIDLLLSAFKAREINTFRLTVSHAFHSPLMAPMLEPFEQAARRIVYRAPRIPIVSNLTGEILRPEQVPDAAYWRRHVRGSVRFADGIQGLCDRGFQLFVELGPDAVLCGMAKKISSKTDRVWLPSLERAGDNWQTLLTTLGTLYVQGVPIRWSAVNGSSEHAAARAGARETAPDSRHVAGRRSG